MPENDMTNMFYRNSSADKNDYPVLESLMSELNLKNPASYNAETYGWLFVNVKAYDFPTMDVKGHSNNMRLCVREKSFTWIPEREQHMVVKNLGAASYASFNFYFCGLVKWARQDIVDTLVTYSPGPNKWCYSNAVNIHPTAIAGLTNSDRARISANGWTIVSCSNV